MIRATWRVEPHHGLARRVGRGMVGVLGEKALEVLERGAETFEPLVERGALEHVVGRARLEDQDTVERGERARPVGAARVDVFQIAQHAREDVPPAHRLQHRRLQLDRLAVDLFEAGADVVEVEDRAAVERVDNQLAALVDRLDQEVRGEGDAEEVEPGAPSDLEVDHRERDRDAEAALQHVVEKRVARVAVVVAIARKAGAHEQEVGERLHALDRVLGLAQRALRRAPQRRQMLEVVRDVEVGIFLLGDQQGAVGERNRFASGDAGKFGPRRIHLRYITPRSRFIQCARRGLFCEPPVRGSKLLRSLGRQRFHDSDIALQFLRQMVSLSQICGAVV